MKRLITILPLLSLLVISCHREPYADATVDLNPAYVGEYVRFASYSTNASYIEWNMDDGYTYNEPVVDHFFVKPGAYDVRLSAFGDKGGISTAVIPMEVIGSIVTIVVEDIDYEGTLIPDVEIYLFESMGDWNTGDIDLAIGPFYTDNYGEVTIDGLDYKEYYVDAFLDMGAWYYANWWLGDDENDTYWIETQLLTGWEYHTFYAYVGAYDWPESKKSTNAEDLRKGRIHWSPESRQLKSAVKNHPKKENKTSVKRENR
ncbi:MAG: PKD domain-containing protein [Bacteroidota bacterium]|nr:PKD domain-containing protein [Bacteroidota bacterium]